jgi:nucleoid-associated protein YgaU
MDTFRADVKSLLTVEQEEAPKAEIGNGSVVEFNTNAARYTPAGKEIPAWVKSDYNHIVTQTTSRGKEVIKDGEKCVLLGKKQSKRGGEIVAGINTWVAKSNLKLVEDRTETTEQQRTYTVQRGDTLWGIAKKALGKGARYTEIVKLNGLKTSTIYAGQVLKIPQK